jgi:hypothetical protein
MLGYCVFHAHIASDMVVRMVRFTAERRSTVLRP